MDRTVDEHGGEAPTPNEFEIPSCTLGKAVVTESSSRDSAQPSPPPVDDGSLVPPPTPCPRSLDFDEVATFVSRGPVGLPPLVFEPSSDVSPPETTSQPLQSYLLRDLQRTTSATTPKLVRFELPNTPASAACGRPWLPEPTTERPAHISKGKQRVGGPVRLPPNFEDYDDASDSESSVSSADDDSVASASPAADSLYDTHDIRLARLRMPWFERLKGHGLTTYGPAPSNCSEVPPGTKRTSGVTRYLERPWNKHFLAEREEFRRHQRLVHYQDYNNRAWYRSMVNRMCETHSERRELLTEMIERENKMYRNTSEWMNETGSDFSKISHCTSPRATSLHRTSDRVTHATLSTHDPSPSHQICSTLPKLAPVADDLLSELKPDGTPISDREKPLVPRAPQHETRKAVACCRCSMRSGANDMFACSRCGHDAYCSIFCQQAYIRTFCSGICEKDSTAVSELQYDEDSTIANTQLSRTNDTLSLQSNNSGRKRSIDALSDYQPLEFVSPIEGFESSGDFEEMILPRKPLRVLLPKPPPPGTFNTSGLTPINSSRGDCVAESSKQGSKSRTEFRQFPIQDLLSATATVEGSAIVESMSAEELQAQINAYAEYERRRSTSQDARDWKIVNFEIRDNGRVVYYEVENLVDESRRWAPAPGMYIANELWAAKIRSFWREPENKLQLNYLENPRGRFPVEPGPFGKFIMNARLDDGKIVFNRRHDDEKDPSDPLCKQEGAFWVYAFTLGPEWDKVIDDYWRYCFVCIDAEKRSRANDARYGPYPQITARTTAAWYEGRGKQKKKKGFCGQKS